MYCTLEVPFQSQPDVFSYLDNNYSFALACVSIVSIRTRYLYNVWLQLAVRSEKRTSDRSADGRDWTFGHCERTTVRLCAASTRMLLEATRNAPMLPAARPVDNWTESGTRQSSLGALCLWLCVCVPRRGRGGWWGGVHWAVCVCVCVCTTTTSHYDGPLGRCVELRHPFSEGVYQSIYGHAVLLCSSILYYKR